MANLAGNAQRKLDQLIIVAWNDHYKDVIVSWNLLADMEKENFFTQARIKPNLFYSKYVRKLQQK